VEHVSGSIDRGDQSGRFRFCFGKSAARRRPAQPDFQQSSERPWNRPLGRADRIGSAAPGCRL